MAHPAEKPTAADPEPGRDDQPDNPAQELAVVKLANAGEDKRQDCSDTRTIHAHNLRRLAPVSQVPRSHKAPAPATRSRSPGLGLTP